jgi:hypothetical protein
LAALCATREVKAPSFEDDKMKVNFVERAATWAIDVSMGDAREPRLIRGLRQPSSIEPDRGACRLDRARAVGPAKEAGGYPQIE